LSEVKASKKKLIFDKLKVKITPNMDIFLNEFSVSGL
jgi:hypothetical protein